MPPVTSDPLGARRSPWREALLIGLLALTLNLAGNGRTSLWDRDEPRYAGAAREMRASGDWINPTFNAEPRYHKPVLIYWLMQAGLAVGGDNAFGARLVSALMGVGTVLLTWTWTRRVLGPRAGTLAGLVLATMPLMVFESKLSTTDATLTFFFVGCQLALWELAAKPSLRAALAFWGLLGLAVLTKSPAAPALLVASTGVGWLLGGPSPLVLLRRLRWRWGLSLFAAIVVPWNVAILVRSGGEYFDVAVGYHILRRATQGLEEHGGFPGYYVVVGMGTLLPWAALFPAALAAAWGRRRESPAAGFLIGWAIGPLIFLECVRTKLIHYYLPAVPALAVLTAWLLDRLLEAPAEVPARRLLRTARRLIGITTAVEAAGLVAAVALVLPGPMRLPALVLAAVVAIGGLAAVREATAGRWRNATAVLVGHAAAMGLVLTGWLIPAAEPYRSPSVVGARMAALEHSVGALSALCTFRPPGVVYALGHPAPVLRTRDEFVEYADYYGRLLMPLTPYELDLLRADPDFDVEVHETVEGLNIEKFRDEILYLATVAPAEAPPIVARPDDDSLTR